MLADTSQAVCCCSTLTCARAGYSALSAATPPSGDDCERGTEMSSQAVRVATPTQTSTAAVGKARLPPPLA